MRLLTRSDFDGLVCGAILKELGVIDSCEFVHPSDIREGLVRTGEDDVLANVPYIPGCKLWFDHHGQTLDADTSFTGLSRPANCTASLVYEYYGGERRLAQFADIVAAVNKIGAGNLNPDEILHPTGWVLLGFLVDPRTGLGRFRNFRVSNYDLMEILIDACRTEPIEEILENLDVQERLEMYLQHAAPFAGMLRQYSRVYGNAVVTDLRGVQPIYTGNRFYIYTLYPAQNISLWIVDGRGKLNCPISIEHSILNRSSTVNAGAAAARYGGNGQFRTGTCQIPYEDAERVIAELTAELNA